MKIISFENKEAWLLGRLRKITGSRLKSIYSKRASSEKKIGYYELIAERLGVPADENEKPMDRGNRLEEEAVARFAKETGKKVDTSLVIWSRDENESIAISPDASVVGEPAAVEAKCLSGAKHIKAYLTQEIPDDYEEQMYQYFVVNDELQTLYFVFFDPRFLSPKLQYFVIEIKRKDIQADITKFLAFEKDTLAEVDAEVNRLTNF